MPADSSQFNLADYFFDERPGETLDHTAIEFRDSRITYRELNDEIDRWAQALVKHGIRESDRVALLLYDSPEFVGCFLATMSIGAVAVPMNTFLAAQDLEFILADSGARLLVIERDLEDRLQLSADLKTRVA